MANGGRFGGGEGDSACLGLGVLVGVGILFVRERRVLVTGKFITVSDGFTTN